ncbi:MAG: pyridine nucleotide-disulfide oxidoreductase [Armatimonadetes bacterium 55-13]|nr:FAD-dependent oxidoreductase [Armatimonadota bacterium]OJU65790.1 MAG: pyridine nucleotide-disulfide oxidoreductase [Armatimonadetes bacterium 55-13]
MAHYRYLIVGAGMTADSAVKGIRSRDAEGSIGMFGLESHAAYDRPPLSKALWKGDSEETVWRKTPYDGVELHLGVGIESIDPSSKTASDSNGDTHSYEKLLLATGVSPRRLDLGDDGIIYYRTFEDYRRLRELTETGNRFVVIGGGFIGSEIAAALTMNDKQAILVFPGEGIGGNLFPADLARNLNAYYEEKGVVVLPHSQVVSCSRRGEQFLVTIKGADSEREELVDGVVAGVGTVLNGTLAQEAGLDFDQGVKVNSSLQTSDPNIYAAGDVATFFDPTLQEWRRVEHEDNANSMGEFVGRVMAGEVATFTHLPFFYSDLFELGYEAVGDVDSRLETFADWTEPFREGVVYYLREGRVRGVLLWNVWDQVPAATELIAEAGPFTPETLKGRLPR